MKILHATEYRLFDKKDPKYRQYSAKGEWIYEWEECELIHQNDLTLRNFVITRHTKTIYNLCDIDPQCVKNEG